MRIIAGKKRGMKLYSANTMETRPITDRVKESLFSVLNNYDMIEGKIVADVFSGVGSLGLEALSRGAAFATFVEKGPEMIRVLKRNIEKAEFTAQSRVIRADAFAVGAPLTASGQTNDLIFLDPPYALSRDVSPKSRLGKLLDIAQHQLEPTQGLLIVRTDNHTHLFDSYGLLTIHERRQWGSMAVTIMKITRENQNDLQ